MDNKISFSDEFLTSRFLDYIVHIDNIWFLASYDKATKRKGLYLIEEDDIRLFNIDYNMLYAELRLLEDDFSVEIIGYEEEDYYDNLVKLNSLSNNKIFIINMHKKEPIYYVFTEQDGHEKIRYKGKDKYIL